MPRKSVRNFARPLFSLGEIVATKAVLIELEKRNVKPEMLLARHHSGDWGDLHPFDKEMNDEAVLDDSRLFSAYDLGGIRIWIITEAGRSATTILLPSEY